MAQFIVRVELHAADAEDYERLHIIMASNGYSREIQDGAGNWFYLPSAEYVTYKNANTELIRDEVRLIAGSVKQEYYILVTQTAAITWWLKRK